MRQVKIMYVNPATAETVESLNKPPAPANPTEYGL